MIKKLKENTWLQLAVIYTRYLIGGSFLFASIIKIKGRRFTTHDGIEHPINSAWHFFETLYQSGLYWKFIGVAQLVAAGLLMTQRYAKLGAISFLPIILNIFIITISYDFAYTPIITGLILIANIGLLLWHSDELNILFNKPYEAPASYRLEDEPIWILTGISIFLFTLFYRIFDFYNPLMWGLVCLSIGLLSLIIRLILLKN